MLLKVIICGVALSSLWLWIFALIRKELKPSMLKLWLKIVVPQGILIAYALVLIGVL